MGGIYIFEGISTQPNVNEDVVASLVVSVASYTMLFVRCFPLVGTEWHLAFLQVQERSFAGGGGGLTLCPLIALL